MIQNGIWRYRDGAREKTQLVTPRLETNDAATALRAAEPGHGITGMYSYRVAKSIQAGRLVPVLDAVSPPSVPVHLVYPQGRFVAPKVCAFMAFAAPLLTQALEGLTPAGAGQSS